MLGMIQPLVYQLDYIGMEIVTHSDNRMLIYKIEEMYAIA